jgi:site-specific recombinase XerD
MFKVADLRERVLLSLATDLGLRIGDFLKIRIDDLPPLTEEPPIQIVINTRKEEVLANGFISSETVELLKDYLPTLDKSKNQYLFPNNNGNHISDIWFNELIQKLAQKSGISVNGKSLTSHCFRKMFLSASVNAGFEVAGKKMVGKTIDQSDDTYYTTLNLRDPFIQIKKFLTIQMGRGQSSESIDSLKSTISEMQKDLQKQSIIIESITEKLEQVQPLIDLANVPKEDLEGLRIIENKIKNLSQEEYALFIPAISDLLRKTAESQGLTIEGYIDELIKSSFDLIRGIKSTQST